MHHITLKGTAIFCLALGLAGCKPESRESLFQRHVESLDVAVEMFDAGQYEKFENQFSVAFEPSIELSTRLPKHTVEKIKAGGCTSVTALAYRRLLIEYLEPMSKLYRREGKISLSERHALAERLADLLNDKRVGRHLIDNQKSTKDCNKYFAGYYPATKAAEQFVLAKVEVWLKDFARLSERDALDLVAEYDEGRRRNNSSSWSRAGSSDRNLFTGGDQEVENCISATIGTSGTPQGVGLNEISTLCRQGLQ